MRAPGQGEYLLLQLDLLDGLLGQLASLLRTQLWLHILLQTPTDTITTTSNVLSKLYFAVE